MKEIKKGGFGTVFLVKDIKNGQELALKEIVKTEEIKKELEVIKKIGNKHGCNEIVKIFDNFNEDDKCYIVMEYCSKGSLHDIIESQKRVKVPIEEKVFF
jgi:serine/threonine protein kinase